MKSLFLISVLSIGTLLPTVAWGHGVPINISVDDSRLIASHPLDQTFAPPIFGQPDESDDFAFGNDFPGLGNVLIWDIPGLDIHGMNDNASLAIEVLARPVIGSSLGEHRVLWYWDPVSMTVEESSAEFHLLGTGPRSITLQPDNQQSLPPFVLAAPVAGETGFHNHTLLLYGLDDDAVAPAGVYGFFARFVSDSYESSDSFLLLFNYFSDNELLSSAGLAIHEAATLPGDFDLDDDVDGRDFLIWQRLFGSTTRTVVDVSLDGIVDAADLAIWQQNYGTVFGAGSPLAAIGAPEPASMIMIVSAFAVAGLARRR
jgi:hypothetical protein